MSAIDTVTGAPGELDSLKAAVRAFFDLVALAEPITIELWRSHQLTLTQVQCLRRLKAGPLPVGDLARATGLSAASMTRLIERLEDRGLVERAPDPQDRRRVVVSLTDRGRSTLGGLHFWANSPVWRALAAMEPAERDAVATVLLHLGERIRRETDPDRPAGFRSLPHNPAPAGAGADLSAADGRDSDAGGPTTAGMLPTGESDAAPPVPGSPMRPADGRSEGGKTTP